MSGEFKAEELKMVAEQLYPDHKWLIDQGGGTGRKPAVILYESHVGPHFDHRFAPSLDGASIYKCQALDCIVAADKLRAFKIRRMSTMCLREDVLTAAISCLLEDSA